MSWCFWAVIQDKATLYAVLVLIFYSYFLFAGQAVLAVHIESSLAFIFPVGIILKKNLIAIRFSLNREYQKRSRILPLDLKKHS